MKLIDSLTNQKNGKLLLTSKNFENPALHVEKHGKSYGKGKRGEDERKKRKYASEERQHQQKWQTLADKELSTEW